MKIIDKKNRSIIYILKLWIWVILLISCAIEVMLYPQEENILGCLVLVYGQILISKFVATLYNFRKYPLATLPVSFYGFFYYFLALPITLIEGKPLTFNFQVPFLMWGNHIISITVIVIAFLISKHLYKNTNLLNIIWRKVGYFTVPQEASIWALGFLGLAAFVYNMLNFRYRGDYQATGNAATVIINCLQVLAVCPLCLYFKHLYGDNSRAATKGFVKYYIVLFALVGVATTRRGPIFAAFLSIALVYFYLLIINNKKVFTTKTTVLVIIGFYLVTGPIADLAAAMAINRQLQGSTSVKVMFEKVWETYQDKELLHNSYQAVTAFADNGGDNSVGWSEYYIDNIFLDRFCNLRVIDATLYNAKVAGYNNSRGHEYFDEYWANQIPSFITNSLGIHKTVHGTVTDEMLIGNFGEKRYSIMGSKVGGETGIGLYLFGYNYYIFAFFVYIVFFYIMNTFSYSKGGSIVFPVPVIASFMTYCTIFNNANGIFTVMDTFTRPKINDMLVYCILIFILSIIFGKKKIA